jgi:hypothetical protein
MHEGKEFGMPREETVPSQGPFDFRHAYVRDGVMRAYANRFAVLAFVSGAIALLSFGFAVYVCLQPPTIIRITSDGEVNVINGRSLFHKRTPAALANAASSPEPMDYEKERIVQDFIEDYLNYDFKNVADRWVTALNLTTDTLRDFAKDVIKKENRVGLVKADKVRSTFEIRQIERSKTDDLSYTVYGVRNVYRMDGTREFAEEMVNRYEIRLALLDRSGELPRGLLIADYRETQLEGEEKTPSFAVDTGGIAPGDTTKNRSGEPAQ